MCLTQSLYLLLRQPPKTCSVAKIEHAAKCGMELKNNIHEPKNKGPDLHFPKWCRRKIMGQRTEAWLCSPGSLRFITYMCRMPQKGEMVTTAITQRASHAACWLLIVLWRVVPSAGAVLVGRASFQSPLPLRWDSLSVIVVLHIGTGRGE